MAAIIFCEFGGLQLLAGSEPDLKIKCKRDKGKDMGISSIEKAVG